jgi:hypothetical protein
MARFLKAAEFCNYVNYDYSTVSDTEQSKVLGFLEKIESDVEQYLTTYRGKITRLSLLERFFTSSEGAAYIIPYVGNFMRLTTNNEISLSFTNVTLTASPYQSNINWASSELGWTLVYQPTIVTNPVAISVRSVTRYPKSLFSSGQILKYSFKTSQFLAAAVQAGTATFFWKIEPAAVAL